MNAEIMPLIRSADSVMKVVRRQVLLIYRDVELTPDFPTRTLCKGKELQKLLVAVSLEALGNVGHDGDGSSASLVT